MTNKSDERFLLEAYNTGFDECIIRPNNPSLFLAKVSAWLRYSRIIPSSLVDDLKVNDFLLEISERRLTVPNGSSIHLTYLETTLLYILMNHPGKTVDPVTLYGNVWGKYGNGDGVMLKNLIYRLRRKIESNPDKPSILLSKGRSGYSFSTE